MWMNQKKDDVQNYLAEKRTELAQERTVLAYFRTAASLFLFGIAFIGFQEQAKVLYYSGRVAIVLGIIFVIIALMRGWKHQIELLQIKERFKHLLRK